MKALIAVMSWIAACRGGVNDSQRGTFLQDVAKFSDLDYKIFLGDGTGTGEDEYDINKSFESADYGAKAKNAPNNLKVPFDYSPKVDELMFQVPDDFLHASYKAKKMWQWALDNGYDYVFQCMSDTYVDVEKLMHSGFEEHDFIGCTYDTNRCPHGGAGYWLNKKCLEIMTKAHVDYWADDGWAGWTLPKHGIKLYPDPRYGNFPYNFPTRQNNIITAHLNATVSDMMYSIHQQR